MIKIANICVFVLFLDVKKGELYRVHSFWKYFSGKLCEMHDPRLNQKYLPLHLQKAYWIDRFQKNSMFEAGNKMKKNGYICSGVGVNANSISSSIEYHILLELHSNKTKKFQLIKAIIQESNPHLNVVRAYTLIFVYFFCDFFCFLFFVLSVECTIVLSQVLRQWKL